MPDVTIEPWMREAAKKIAGCDWRYHNVEKRIATWEMLERIIATAYAAREQDGELRKQIRSAIALLETVVCVREPDEGVVYLSDEGPTHYDTEAKCQVYDHEYFSPLGDALIGLYKKLKEML